MRSFALEIITGIMLTLIFIFSLSLFNSSITSSTREVDFRMSVGDVVPTHPVITSSQPVILSTTTAISEEKNGDDGRSYFLPKSKRNPFLSPEDYERLKIVEEQKIRQEELIRKMRSDEPGVKREDPTKKYKLQGIVGKYAIINGEMIGEGEIYKKDIKLEKVYSNYVIIKYKGKSYKLIIK